MSEHVIKTKDRGTLELALGEQIHALISASHALNVRSAERFDATLQPAAFHLVRWLYSYGPTSAAVLAEATAMDRSSVSRLIKQLEKSGYVRKEQDLDDRRGVLLSLTERGQQTTMSALKEKESTFYESISSWDDGELERFTTMLRQFNGLGGEVGYSEQCKHSVQAIASEIESVEREKDDVLGGVQNLSASGER